MAKKKICISEEWVKETSVFFIVLQFVLNSCRWPYPSTLNCSSLFVFIQRTGGHFPLSVTVLVFLCNHVIFFWFLDHGAYQRLLRKTSECYLSFRCYIYSPCPVCGCLSIVPPDSQQSRLYSELMERPLSGFSQWSDLLRMFFINNYSLDFFQFMNSCYSLWDKKCRQIIIATAC